jgi:membrane protease YdiL (CAAX protease family)
VSAEPPVREAGWYADPYERKPWRYWDGERWTAYAADDTVQWDEVGGEPGAEAEPRRPGLRGLGVGAAGYVIGVALAFAIQLVLYAADHPGGRTAELVISELGLWGGLVGACVYVSRRRGSRSVVRDFDWHFRWIDIGFGFAGSIAGRVVAASLVAPIPLPFRHPSTPDKDVFNRVSHSAFGWPALILVTCVGAPIIEELFFRGLIQTRLVDVIGVPRGIVVASLLFGGAHLIAWQGPITLVYGLAVAGSGLVLGLLRHITGRLGPSTWAHVFFNAQAVLAVALLR